MATRMVVVYETVELRGAELEELELRHAEFWPSRHPRLGGRPLQRGTSRSCHTAYLDDWLELVRFVESRGLPSAS